ncbi:hypothetical protein P367_05735 [Comamonas thiooxydans]|nr:hypothetical protein P369_14965 [Comamonas thiooxydans]KGH00562.1 hypothetical protein P367_05735 [Comamonas thiooxydans]
MMLRILDICLGSSKRIFQIYVFENRLIEGMQAMVLYQGS